MHTIAPPPDKTTDRPLPPPGAAPYFRVLPAPNWPVIDTRTTADGVPSAT